MPYEVIDVAWNFLLAINWHLTMHDYNNYSGHTHKYKKTLTCIANTKASNI